MTLRRWVMATSGPYFGRDPSDYDYRRMHRHVCALDGRLHIVCRCACGQMLPAGTGAENPRAETSADQDEPGQSGA